MNSKSLMVPFFFSLAACTLAVTDPTKNANSGSDEKKSDESSSKTDTPANSDTVERVEKNPAGTAPAPTATAVVTAPVPPTPSPIPTVTPVPVPTPVIDAGSDASTAMVSCNTYCTNVMRCDYYQHPIAYETKAQCMAACSYMDMGTFGSTVGDTVACRQQAATRIAQVSMGEFTYCKYAGLSGGGNNIDMNITGANTPGCSSPSSVASGRCGTFCKMTMRVCDGSTNRTKPFDTESDCNYYCNNILPTGFPYSTFNQYQQWDEYDATGNKNTLNCRMHYLLEQFKSSSTDICKTLGRNQDMSNGRTPVCVN